MRSKDKSYFRDLGFPHFFSHLHPLALVLSHTHRQPSKQSRQTKIIINKLIYFSYRVRKNEEIVLVSILRHLRSARIL